MHSQQLEKLRLVRGDSLLEPGEQLEKEVRGRGEGLWRWLWEDQREKARKRGSVGLEMTDKLYSLRVLSV